MTRAIVAALVAAGAVLGFGRGAIAENSWLVTNTCRLDDCYLKWVMSVTPLEPETFRLAIVIAPWNGNDDPPVLGEPVTIHIKVSCRSDSSYVEDAHGKRLMIPVESSSSPSSLHSQPDEVAVWIGICKNQRELIVRGG